jgi:hypothetical protein
MEVKKEECGFSLSPATCARAHPLARKQLALPSVVARAR